MDRRLYVAVKVLFLGKDPDVQHAHGARDAAPRLRVRGVLGRRPEAEHRGPDAVGIKLVLEYLHNIHVVDFVIPKWLSLGLIVVIFAISMFYARRHGPKAPDPDDGATALLNEQKP